MLDELVREQKLLKEHTARIGEYLRIGEKQKQLEELKQRSQSPDLWADPDRAKKVLKDLSLTEKEINEYAQLSDQVAELETFLSMAGQDDEPSLREEFGKLQQRAVRLELTALLSGPYDKSNAILSINAGAGGTDAQDWAQMLMRMYVRWSESKGYKVEVLDLSYGEEAGIKSATMMVSGDYAYGYLKCEKGVHRLVRLSPFNSDGKRHTSFASVEVIPEITEEIEVNINPADLRVDTYRASGPGGQNVNKVSSAIRITHLPTGIVVQSQSDRSQQANRETAMRVLKAKLYEMMLNERKEKIEELKGERKAIEWGSQIRSYVFQPYTLVKDNRTGTEVGNVQGVMDGDLDLFMEAMLKSSPTKA
ncbi:MAG TPA: peptide chain release factor 2 [Candidatus Omnitrophota bacterium]|nr:peptide chain release factor 2 [Candidatus Omnitrophota bacterium]